jgi:hypothetical protein
MSGRTHSALNLMLHRLLSRPATGINGGGGEEEEEEGGATPTHTSTPNAAAVAAAAALPPEHLLSMRVSAP